ncbi:MAG TPA: homoserine kinase, partial [Candidatus Dormibacteraeota bacterium]|nr:homoserine kinase [Candidatus Dormibacteraeota bacterium]
MNLSAYNPNRKPGVQVVVPASTANLGPGFDVLALTLELVNTFEVWEHGEGLTIEVSGEGEGTLPLDERNLFAMTMNTFFSMAGYQPPGLLIRLNNKIPLARGLGSSASVIVGALLAARYLSGYAMDDDRLLDLAASLEGHGDNVAAAARGGCVLVIPEGDGRQTVRKIIWPRRIGCALFVPELLVSTESAREVLPAGYRTQEVVFNLAHLALFISAVQEQRFEDFRLAMEDKLHQPWRAELVPGMDRIMAAAVMAGAAGACLSGAGPTILALYDRDGAGGQTGGETIANAMKQAAAQFGVDGRTMAVESRLHGAEFRA